MFEKRPLREAIGAQLGGGTPPRAIASYWGGNIPWASVKDFTDDGAILASTVESITPEGLRASSSNLIPSGTPLVCTRMAVGRSALAPMPVAINQDVKALVPAEGVGGSYLLRLLQYIQPAAASAAIGSTVKGIRIQDYLSLPVPLAPQTEQEAIVEVLDTLDTTIRQTEAIIAKLKQVKQGLLHDLLTRGIAANGELRPPQSEAPHLYKASPLGWIPHDWGVDTLAALSVGGLMNGVFKEPRRVGRGVALINVADLYRGEKIDLESCERFAATAVEIDRFGVTKGDIFFTRSSLKLDGIAQTSLVEVDPNDAVFECHVMRLRPAARITVPRYLKEWCVSRHARSHFMSHAKQVTMTTISQDGINTLLCPVPPIEEQAEAIRRVIAIDARISAEEQNLHKAQLLKSGLMDDLLTGRVRVTPLLKQEVTT
jgi:type I restriction enzyme S subunit